MRILHIVDLSDHASAPGLACASAVSRLRGSHTVWTIGHPALPAGWLTPSRRLAAPTGSPLLAWRALRRALDQHRNTFDLVTCWSIGALSAFHAASPRSPLPLVGVLPCRPHRTPRSLSARLWRTVLDRATLLCFSQTAAERWRLDGAGDIRIAPPFLHTSLDMLPSRETARASLRIEPHERVLCLLADPPLLADARRFAYLTGLLSVGGAPTVALVSAHSAQVRRGARFVRECGRLWRIVPCREPLAAALPACDAALVDIRVLPTHPLAVPDAGADVETTADALAISVAAQLGVPVVLPRHPLATELLRAGVPINTAADSTCLALAAALFPFMDQQEAGRGGAEFKPGAPGLEVLHEIWLEKLNAVRPGFPLSPARALPPVIDRMTVGRPLSPRST